MHAHAFATPRKREAKRSALLDQEQITCAEHKQNQRVAIQAVFQATQTGAPQILVDRQYAHIAVTAMAEIAAAHMMPRVCALPKVIRSQRQDPAEGAQHVI